LYKVLRKTGKVLLFIFASILALLIISTITNNILKVIEKNKCKAPGVMVDVNGEKMHVYSQGNGSKTIVLLSGFGTPSPVVDFAPLIRELKTNYTVVVVENFGYGWSDLTNKPRTIDNIMEETRTALKEAGFKPPYILMPHSVSGIYSLYYANKYPNEISAVVGIDASVPAEYSDRSKSGVNYGYLDTIEEFTGLVRIATKVEPSLGKIQAPEGTYTEDEQKLYRLMLCWRYHNKTMVNEGNNGVANYGATVNMKFPETIPVLYLLSQTSSDNYKSSGEDWVEMHQEVIGDSDQSKIIVLPGDHYLHRTCATEMAEDTKQFLDGLKT
jgi:pimeloyl-ACP methyl ester carboxylesterase